MRSIVHHDIGQLPERMKFLRIIFGCPEGARKWRILFAMLLHSKQTRPPLGGVRKTVKPTYGYDHRSVLCYVLARQHPGLPCVKGAVSEAD